MPNIYYIYIFISTVIILFLSTRLFNRFWSTQPVFHFYNIWYWMFPPGLVDTKLPKETKFYNDNIVCDISNKLSTEKKALIIVFC